MDNSYYCVQINDNDGVSYLQGFSQFGGCIVTKDPLHAQLFTSAYSAQGAAYNISNYDSSFNVVKIDHDPTMRQMRDIIMKYIVEKLNTIDYKTFLEASKYLREL